VTEPPSPFSRVLPPGDATGDLGQHHPTPDRLSKLILFGGDQLAANEYADNRDNHQKFNESASLVYWAVRRL